MSTSDPWSGQHGPPNLPPAGWYQNPEGPGQRYWDGQMWTEHYSDQPAPPQYAAPQYAPNSGYGQYPPAAPGPSGLVIAGYIFAVLIPFVGFILGIVAVTRPQPAISKQGVWIIVVSVVAFVVWLSIAASS
jgi:hypothetical protein